VSNADTDDQWFGSIDVANVIKTRRSVMHSWIHRGHLRVPSRGQGKSRQFSLPSVIEMAVITELVRLGMTIRAASEAMYSVSGTFRQVLQENYGWGKVLVVGGGRTWILPSVAVPGFVRDLGITSYSAVDIHNVASATHRALTTATATIPAEATLQATETIIRRALPERAKGESECQ